MNSIHFGLFLETAERLSFFNKEMASTKLNLAFIEQKDSRGNVCFANSPELRSEFKETFTQTDLFSYFYAVLFSSRYRNSFQDLRTDLSSILIMEDKVKFWKLVQLGGELRKIHLSEDNNYIPFPAEDDNIVTEIKFERNCTNECLGKIYLNDNQYFDNVPEAAWHFRMDNSQLAQKWLENRKGFKINAKEILEYQKLITSLSETDRIAKIIDSYSG